jgi:hypothetical protein
MPFQPESGLELNRKGLEKFPISPTVISTPWYDKRFESYDFLKSAGLSKFWADQIFFWFGLTTIPQNSANWMWCRIRINVQCRSDREFWDLFRKHKYTLIRPTVQELWSLKFGGGASSGQIELSGQIWTLRPLPKEFRKNSKYKNPREIL